MNHTLSPQVAAQRPVLRFVRSIRRAIERATDDRTLQRFPALRRYPY